MASEPRPFPTGGRRVILFLIDDRRFAVSDATISSMQELRPFASNVVAVIDGRTPQEQRDRLVGVADAVVSHDGVDSNQAAFLHALRRAPSAFADADEIVFTGNSWFGPVRSLGDVFDRMDREAVHVWQMTGNIDGRPEAFPEEGFPGRSLSWLWLAVRRDVVGSPSWMPIWDGPARAQHEFAAELAASGFVCGEAFPAANYPRGDPALFAPDLLIDDGCPLLSKEVFAQYPPFMDRHAVLGREIIALVASYGLPLDAVWDELARNTPPKALNAIAGMLEVLPEEPTSHSPDRPFRIAVIAYLPRASFVDDLYRRLESVPRGFDLYITTPDGARAREAEMRVADWEDPRFSHFETRVSWTRRGHEKAALYIACRDLVLGDRYDLLVSVHGRTWQAQKTDNMRYYGRRYQLDNLFSSPGYFANLLDLFQREPGLGLVFPPMPHVGNALMGRGWGAYRDAAEALSSRLSLRVPIDRISPLAPFGGMWVGRPSAVRPLAAERWTDDDYGRGGRKKYIDLGRLQDRMLTLVAGEGGFHARTVLNAEHAAISHTSLEYKNDQLFATTKGYPVERMRFLHRLGFTGHGGTVALTRMYLKANHPRTARAFLPLYRIALRGFFAVRSARDALRRLTSDEGN